MELSLPLVYLDVTANVNVALFILDTFVATIVTDVHTNESVIWNTSLSEIMETGF